MRLRVALFAATAVLGGVTLSACQNSPEVAAYIGADTITEAQVDAVLTDAELTLPTATPAAPDSAAPDTAAPDSAAPTPAASPAPNASPTLKITRVDVLRAMLLDKVCAAEQAKQGFASAENAGGDGGGAGVATTSQYAIIYARMAACLNGSLAKTVAVKPTDAEALDIYNRAAANKLVDKSFADLKDTLEADQGVQQAIGQKRTIEDLVKAEKLTVNPRYRPLDLPINDLGSGVALVVVSIGQPGSDAVHNA